MAATDGGSNKSRSGDVDLLASLVEENIAFARSRGLDDDEIVAVLREMADGLD